MEWKSSPRNENLTIRITKNEKREFEELARKNHTSRSNWARHILCKHKHNYDEIEEVNPVLNGLEVAIKILNLIDNKMLPIKIPTDIITQEKMDFIFLKGEVNSEIRRLKKLKSKIEN